MSKETKTSGTEVVVPEAKGTSVMAYTDEFSDFAGFGMENVTARDLMIPRVAILQDLSPQCKSTKPEYIKGAEAGMVCDVATGDLFPQGIIFLPAYYRKDWLEWAPRASGKGLVAIHQDDGILAMCERDEKGKYFTKQGNLIQETSQFFGFNLSAGGRMCFIPMAGTQLKKARKWLNLTTGEKLRRDDGTTFTPPLFYRCYMMTSVHESNNEGDWFGWKIERGPSLPEIPDSTLGCDWRAMKDQAIKFQKQVVAGEARAGEFGGEEEQNASSEGAM